MDDMVLESIQRLTLEAETTISYKEKLERLLLEWPTACSKEIGHSSRIKHLIITTEELPVRKKAYRLYIDKPGHMIGVDLMGPFPKSVRQNEHLLVVVDY